MDFSGDRAGAALGADVGAKLFNGAALVVLVASGIGRVLTS